MGWTSFGGSVKLPISAGGSSEEYRPELARQLTRQILYRSGIAEEWLLKGIPTFVASSLGEASTGPLVAGFLRDVLRLQRRGELLPLADMVPDYALSREEWQVAMGQAADAWRHIAAEYGDAEALPELLEATQEGQSVEQALESVFGRPAADLEAAWLESLAQVHSRPEWVTLAESARVDSILADLDFLASANLRGRANGSPEAIRAA